jgi:O-antigen/teichoic acid export membrane protein
VLSFFLVPLYTSILSTAEYGKYDLVNTTVSLLIPVLTINISVAVFRFSIDGKNQWKDVFSVGLRYLGIGTSIVIALLIINSFWICRDIF